MTVAVNNGSAFVGTTTGQASFKQTVYRGTTNITTTSATMVDIDATNLPPLSLTLAIGDVVDLSLQAIFAQSGTGLVTGFDWLIGQPTSGNTSVGATGSYWAAYLWEGATNGKDCQTETARGTFTATEAGVHTFKPQWRQSGGGTATLMLAAAGTYNSPVTHRVENKGPIGSPSVVLGSSPGQILGFTQYSPGAQVATGTSSATYADLDATNLAVTFIAPPSGNILVDLEATSSGAASTDLAWGVREATTVVGSSYVLGGAGAYKQHVSFQITGLVPGSSHTYKFAHARPTGAGTPSTVYGNTGAGQANPATMKITAL